LVHCIALVFVAAQCSSLWGAIRTIVGASKMRPLAGSAKSLPFTCRLFLLHEWKIHRLGQSSRNAPFSEVTGFGRDASMMLSCWARRVLLLWLYLECGVVANLWLIVLAWSSLWRLCRIRCCISRPHPLLCVWYHDMSSRIYPWQRIMLISSFPWSI
jgi:hypothetical protein